MNTEPTVKHLENTKLIDLVQKRPELWSKTHSCKTREHRAILWNEVANGIGKAVEESKRKWEILRDIFRRELKKGVNITTGEYKSEWYHFRHMLFIKEVTNIKPKPEPVKVNHEDFEIEVKKEFDSFNNLDSTESTTFNTTYYPQVISQNESHNNESYEENNYSDSPKVSSHHNNHNSNIYESQKYDSTNSEPEPVPKIRKLSSHSHYQDRYVSMENSFGKFPNENDVDFHKKLIESSDYHFALSLVPFMKTVNESNKLRMRMRLVQVLLEENLKNEEHKM